VPWGSFSQGCSADLVIRANLSADFGRSPTPLTRAAAGGWRKCVLRLPGILTAARFKQRNSPDKRSKKSKSGKMVNMSVEMGRRIEKKGEVHSKK